MAGRFSKQQWDQIEAEMNLDPAAYGMPEGGREESMVFASFNIRKLGRYSSRQRELNFMARFCARCDLIAIQEVQDDLSGLRYLKERVDERVASAGEFELVVSDITGEVPGESGMAERLAFLYRKSRVRRLDMTSDLTVDRSGVLRRFHDNEDAISKAWQEFDEKMKSFKAGTRSSRPTFVLPAFVTFARTPHVTAFEIPAAGTSNPVAFVAVNAHLIYGTMKERKAEFRELVRWITMRLKAEKTSLRRISCCWATSIWIWTIPRTTAPGPKLTSAISRRRPSATAIRRASIFRSSANIRALARFLAPTPAITRPSTRSVSFSAKTKKGFSGWAGRRESRTANRMNSTTESSTSPICFRRRS